MAYVKKVSAITAVAGVLMAPMATPAFALLPPAQNEWTQFLTDNPTALTPPTCVERSITLAAGVYTWQLYFGHPIVGPGTRSIRLAAGTYDWRDCLDPQNGFYEQTSNLAPPSGAVAHLFIESGLFDPSSVVTWGSTLTPTF